jgi:hypothetical protein
MTTPWAVLIGSVIIAGSIMASTLLVAPNFSISGGDGNVWRLNRTTGALSLCSSLVANSTLNNWVNSLDEEGVVPICTNWLDN